MWMRLPALRTADVTPQVPTCRLAGTPTKTMTWQMRRLLLTLPKTARPI
jgi:hypothetical protein